MIEIVNSKFVISAPNVARSPENTVSNEVVFMARSNVGKSSLLNTLSGRKSLAKVSGTPGKTRLINYFSVTLLNRDDAQQHEAFFVDLPGFGYARVSKSIKKDWEKNLTEFIAKRSQIRLFIHLRDARHPELEIDASVDAFLQESCREDQHIVQVFTKIDKLNQKELNRLKQAYPHALMVSNSKKKGIVQLLHVIYHTLFTDAKHDTL